jgi:hypothetical protein
MEVTVSGNSKTMLGTELPEARRVTGTAARGRPPAPRELPLPVSGRALFSASTAIQKRVRQGPAPCASRAISYQCPQWPLLLREVPQPFPDAIGGRLRRATCVHGGRTGGDRALPGCSSEAGAGSDLSGSVPPNPYAASWIPIQSVRVSDSNAFRNDWQAKHTTSGGVNTLCLLFLGGGQRGGATVKVTALC